MSMNIKDMIEGILMAYNVNGADLINATNDLFSLFNDNNQSVINNKENENIKEIVLNEYNKGNIVVSTFEGLKVCKLSEIINQHTDGLLYDINRNEAIVLTLINDPKWINDYATVKVIRELKNQIHKLDNHEKIKCR